MSTIDLPSGVSLPTEWYMIVSDETVPPTTKLFQLIDYMMKRSGIPQNFGINENGVRLMCLDYMRCLFETPGEYKQWRARVIKKLRRIDVTLRVDRARAKERIDAERAAAEERVQAIQEAEDKRRDELVRAEAEAADGGGGGGGGGADIDADSDDDCRVVCAFAGVEGCGDPSPLAVPCTPLPCEGAGAWDVPDTPLPDDAIDALERSLCLMDEAREEIGAGAARD